MLRTWLLWMCLSLSTSLLAFPAHAASVDIEQSRTCVPLDLPPVGGLAFGYDYAYLAISGVPIWTWDGGVVVIDPWFRGSCRVRIGLSVPPELEAALEGLEKPFWYRYPLGVFLLWAMAAMAVLLATVGALNAIVESAKARFR